MDLQFKQKQQQIQKKKGKKEGKFRQLEKNANYSKKPDKIFQNYLICFDPLKQKLFMLNNNKRNGDSYVQEFQILKINSLNQNYYNKCIQELKKMRGLLRPSQLNFFEQNLEPTGFNFEANQAEFQNYFERKIPGYFLKNNVGKWPKILCQGEILIEVGANQKVKMEVNIQDFEQILKKNKKWYDQVQNISISLPINFSGKDVIRMIIKQIYDENGIKLKPQAKGNQFLLKFLNVNSYIYGSEKLVQYKYIRESLRGDSQLLMVLKEGDVKNQRVKQLLYPPKLKMTREDFDYLIKEQKLENKIDWNFIEQIPVFFWHIPFNGKQNQIPIILGKPKGLWRKQQIINQIQNSRFSAVFRAVRKINMVHYNQDLNEKYKKQIFDQKLTILSDGNELFFPSQQDTNFGKFEKKVFQDIEFGFQPQIFKNINNEGQLNLLVGNQKYKYICKENDQILKRQKEKQIKEMRQKKQNKQEIKEKDNLDFEKIQFLIDQENEQKLQDFKENFQNLSINFEKNQINQQQQEKKQLNIDQGFQNSANNASFLFEQNLGCQGFRKLIEIKEKANLAFIPGYIQFEVSLKIGNNVMAKKVVTQKQKFENNVYLNQWVQFEDIKYSDLPLEKNLFDYNCQMVIQKETFENDNFFWSLKSEKNNVFLYDMNNVKDFQQYAEQAELDLNELRKNYEKQQDFIDFAHNFRIKQPKFKQSIFQMIKPNRERVIESQDFLAFLSDDFCDDYIRYLAVIEIEQLNIEFLSDNIDILIEGLKNESCMFNPLCEMLLSKAIQFPWEFGHKFFWSLYSKLYCQYSCEFDFKLSLNNLIRSMAGWYLIVYILGILPRNSNQIRITKQGVLYMRGLRYIFQKHFLSHLGGVEKENNRILNKELVLFLGGTDNQNYKIFEELCVKGYLVLRKNMNFIVEIVQLYLKQNILALNKNQDIYYILEKLEYKIEDDFQAQNKFIFQIRNELLQVAQEIDEWIHDQKNWLYSQIQFLIFSIEWENYDMRIQLGNIITFFYLF
ncbi:Protein kinase-like domain [Pseudocohnilembus persalinus]|uniref:Protein kinase-like domain n=1 Tax=Pseudocohnilembus persalinus TaxID=266149 RepID=A0A0V0QW60_PSEPJ|nr:Protein kinase-like domain [Pseudocohnilembus persalinus]|eukprot:KRX06604.1 Protein kinase-like domain [Pseudocohnilembus persalinus]